MKNLILLIVIGFGFSFTGSKPQIEVSDLKESVHPNDPEAHASYKTHKAWVSFDLAGQGYQLVTRVEEVIKVYDDQGEDYGNFSVPMYRDGGDRQKVFDIKGATYNLVNGKKVKTKLEKKDIYTDEVSDDLHLKKWAMPNVRAGSIIEISYTKRSPWIYTIPRFDFQKEVPIDDLEYQVQIPQYFTYTPITTGLVEVDREEKSRSGSSGLESVFVFTAHDVAGLQDDDYVLDIDDYRSSMKYEIYQVDFPNRPVKNYSKSWKDIAANLQKSDSFGKAINRNNKDFKEIVGSLASATDEVKIQEAFAYVQDNYVWNKEYGINANNGLRTIVQDGTGNIGDINLLLINILKQLDVDAKPLCLKSRWNGMLNPYYPSLSEFNYVVAYVQISEDSYILMDASSKEIPMGQLPIRAVNLHGLLISGDHGEIIQLKNPNEYSYTALNKYEIDLEASALVGGGKSLRKKYAATKYRMELNTEEEEEEEGKDQDEEEEEEEEEIQVENEVEVLEVMGLDNIYDKVTVTYDEKLYNELDIIGDQIFIDATLDYGIKKNPFYEEERNMPIFYNYLQSNMYISTIKIPEGYRIESKPETISMSLEDGSIAFMYEAKEIAGNVKINYKFNIKNDVVSPEVYPGLQEIYSRIVAISKQKIVLSPI